MMVRSVSRQLRNALRRERRSHPTLNMLLAQLKGESAARRAIRLDAEALHARLGRSVTWAACVHAVKTGWSDQLAAKVDRRGKSGGATV